MGDAVTGPSEVEVEAAARAIKCRGCGAEPGFACRGLRDPRGLHALRTGDARAALTAASRIRDDRTAQLLEEHTDQPVVVGRHLTWLCSADDCEWFGGHDASPGTPAWREHLVDVLTGADR